MFYFYRNCICYEHRMYAFPLVIEYQMNKSIFGCLSAGPNYSGQKMIILVGYTIPLPIVKTENTSWSSCSFCHRQENIPGSDSSNCFFHLAIWLGWTSYWLASSAIVLSPFAAAKATFALNAALWLRRLFFTNLSPEYCIVSGDKSTLTMRPVFGEYYTIRQCLKRRHKKNPSKRLIDIRMIDCP